MKLHCLVFAIAAASLAAANPRAGAPQLSSFDINRAINVARGTDADRARFHQAYVFTVNSTPVEYATLDRVEVITEYRRFELAAEEYALRGESIGPGEAQKIERAQRDERDGITIVAHIRLSITTQWAPEVPAVDVAVEGAPAPSGIKRTPIHNSSDAGSFLVGEDVSGLFDRAAVANGTHTVRVTWKGRDLGSSTIDFAALK